MDCINILWRNMKWRFQNPISILLTIIQPLLWLILYSFIAGKSMNGVPGGNYTAFVLPGIMVLVTMACCSSGGYLNYIMKAKGSFYRILTAPVSRASIVLGHLMEAAVLSIIESGILLVLSLFMSVHISSGIIGVILIALLNFLAAMFMSGICYFISLWLPNEMLYETVMNLIVLSVFFASTALFPYGKMTGALKNIVSLNPLTHIINCLRSLVLIQNIDWINIISVTVLCLILALGSFSLALMKLRREMFN